MTVRYIDDAPRDLASRPPAIANLTIADQCRPDWLACGTPLRIPLPPGRPASPANPDAAPLVSSQHKGAVTPLVWKQGASLEWAYPWDRWSSYILREQYATWRRRPLFTVFPVSYCVVPAMLRRRIAARMVQRRARKPDHFPARLFDGGFECLRSIHDRQSGIPSSSMGQICLTHDIDTAEGFDGVRPIAQIEMDLGLRSSWNVVAGGYPLDHKVLDWLVDNGFEIGLHDYRHDNKLIYLPDHALRRRLGRCAEFMRRYNVRGFRSPSWFRAERLLRTLAEYVEYDCSCLDFDWLCPAGGGGVLTPRPFVVDGLVEIPTTIPFEAPVLDGVDPSLTAAYWQPKVEWLKNVGGNAVVNSHPDPHYSGNDVMMRSYRQLLEQLLSSFSNRWSLPRDISREIKTDGPIVV